MWMLGVVNINQAEIPKHRSDVASPYVIIRIESYQEQVAFGGPSNERFLKVFDEGSSRIAVVFD
jgi:hypothetical protein